MNCVAFMSAMFSLQVETEYRKSVVNKRAYEFSIFFLLTGEEIFQLMARLIKSGVSMLIVSTFLYL